MAGELYTRVHNLGRHRGFVRLPGGEHLAGSWRNSSIRWRMSDRPPPAADAARIHKALGILYEVASNAVID